MINEQAQQIELNYWNKFLHWMFPWPSFPEIENEKRTYITTNVFINLDFKDRIKVLITGKILTRTITYTDIEVKQANSISSIGIII